jgi:hypothetical protein
MSTVVELLDQTGRWHSRTVNYWRGRWEQVQRLLPTFTIEDFRSGNDAPPNPHLKTVVRKPTTIYEMPIPVGVVSYSYTLAQHLDVANKCLEGIEAVGVNVNDLDCEIGLTELGEWMNLRIYFPEQYNQTFADKNPIRLRLECMNSVDGSSRLVILLGWFRLVCSNGLVIGETKKEIRDIHNESLDLDKIPPLISDAMELVDGDVARLRDWENSSIKTDDLEPWVNKTVSESWGKKAACRVFHICNSGQDVEFTDPFATGEATEKPVKATLKVPGAKVPAGNLYDVSQAMSWVATSRNNTEERLDWQMKIPNMIEKLALRS